MDRKEVKINKDLALRILKQEEDEDLDEKVTLLTRNLERFLKKKVGVTSYRKQRKKIKARRSRETSNSKRRRRIPTTRSNGTNARVMGM